MEKTYKVTIKTKKNYRAPTIVEIRNAVMASDHCLGATLKSVEVEEVEHPPKTKLRVDYCHPLYAIGRLSPNTGKEWLLMDYFNSYKKAYNAKARSEKITAVLGDAFADDKFAVFVFTTSGNWIKEG
jgi:hypothetical protein